jgi:hypothetical protein
MEPAIDRKQLALRGRRRPARLVIAAAATVLAWGATSAFANIVATVPDVVLFTPADVRLGATESNVRIIAFNERCVVLPYPLQTDEGVIPAGRRVQCHFFHDDPQSPPTLLDGRARFDQDILGVISSSALLDASDPVCGRPGVTYPAPGSEPYRGLEAAQPDDRYQIIDAGRGIHVQANVTAFTDQLRVVTCCDPDGPAAPPDDGYEFLGSD